MFKIYKKLLKYVPDKILYLFFSVILSAIYISLFLSSYYFIYKLFYELIVKGDSPAASNYALIVFSFIIIGLIAYLIALMCSHIVGFSLETVLKKRGVSGIFEAGADFLDNNTSGYIRKTIDDNTLMTHTSVAHLIPDLIVGILTPIIIIVLSFIIDYKIGVATIILFLITVVDMKLMMGEKKFMEYYMNALTRMNEEGVEYIRGIQVIKIFGIDVSAAKALYDAINEYAEKALNYTFSCRIPYIIFVFLFQGLSLILVPIFVVTHNSAPEFVVGYLFFALMLGIMFNNFMKIMYLGMYTYQAEQAIDNLEAIHNDMLSSKVHFGNINEMKKYNIEIDNLSFAYNKEKVIKNISLKLKEDRIYAFIGESGGGKTTIAKLIAGLYPITEGSIKIGGVSIYDYSSKCFHENVDYVFQQTSLFPISIYENIRLGNKNATREEIIEAVKLATLSDLIDRLPNGIDTVIGTKGVYLSGGEMQRVAIARSIVKNSKIIILDEAISMSDPDNEYEIMCALKNLIKGKTVIMIAHRLPSIANVDEIILIDNGVILDTGSDKELIVKSSKYKELKELYQLSHDWRLQNE